MPRLFRTVCITKQVVVVGGVLALLAACRPAAAPPGLPNASGLRGPTIAAEPDLLVLRVPDGSLVEPHLAVNPHDPARMVAIAMKGAPGRQPDGFYGQCVTAFTRDTGRTWQQGESLGAPGCGDAWVLMLRDGTALAAILDDSGTFVFRSANGGESWDKPGVHIPGTHDHEMIVADSADNVYFVAGGAARDAAGAARSAVIIERSTDGGRTFAPRGRGIFSTLTYEAETPILLSDGAMLVSFMDHHDRSRHLLQRRRQWVSVSRDSGMTFLPPSLVSEDCNRRPPVAWPTFARGPAPSAGSPETLFFLCEAPDANGVLFATSVDRGERWTTSYRIDGGRGEGAWMKTPTMAVDIKGTVLVAWQDRRGDPKRLCQRVYAAASADGGATFGSASPVSTTASCPDTPANGAGLAKRFPSGGEYSGLVSLSRGEFYAVWADSRSGRYELRGARIRVLL